jgi:acetyl esterase/lipase
VAKASEKTSSLVRARASDHLIFSPVAMYVILAGVKVVSFFLAFLAASLTLAPDAWSHGEITEQFATADDGTPLNWTVYLPRGRGPWPVVLVIHIGGFREGTPGPERVAQDLVNYNVIAATIDYRLDVVPSDLPNQASPAYAPNIGEAQTQISDVKKAILAARTPVQNSALYGRTNGKVGAVGGSAGAAHACWCALTGNPGRDKLDAAALLSGPYEFDDSASLATVTVGCHDNMPSSFRTDIPRYCNINPNDVNANNPPPALHNASPVYQIISADSVVPLYLLATEMDPITPSQIQDLRDALDAHGVTNYQYELLPGCLHAFEYWFTTDGARTVDDRVGNWLSQLLAASSK